MTRRRFRTGLLGLAVVGILTLNPGCLERFGSADRLARDRAERALQRVGPPEATQEALAQLTSIASTSHRLEDRLWAASEAARLARFEVKDFQRAITHCRQVVLESRPGRDRGLRTDCQRLIADVALEHLQDYKLSIQENHRLLELLNDPKEVALARLNLGKAYFFSDNFFQSRVEAELAFTVAPKAATAFEALRLKASAYQGERAYEEAAATLYRMMELFPDRARSENLTLMLAVLYEDQKDYGKALEVLRSLLDTYHDRAFLQRRIRSLEQRRDQQPGARGLRK